MGVSVQYVSGKIYGVRTSICLKLRNFKMFCIKTYVFGNFSLWVKNWPMIRPSLWANSEHDDQAGVIASFVCASDIITTLHEYNFNDETGGFNPDEASEFPVL